MVKDTFDTEVKRQGHKKIMIVYKTSFHGNTSMCQIQYDHVNGQKIPETKPCQKRFKSDFKVKG